MPIINQIAKRSQLSIGKDAIKIKQTIIPSMGTSGTNGVRNGLSISGFVFRSTNTPMQTNVKANSVPILTMCPKSEMGTKPAKRDTNTMNMRFVFQGVWFLERSENILGSNPSLLME